MFTYSLVQLPMLANAEHDTGLAVATHFVSTKVKNTLTESATAHCLRYRHQE